MERIEIRNEELFLMPERTLFWPSESTLILSDLHWGKVESFRAAGLPLPKGMLASDLDRLSAAIKKTEASKIIVTGDLIHSRTSLEADLIEIVARWRQEIPIEFILVEGNHDRPVALPAIWNIQRRELLKQGPFLFCHEPEEDSESFQICGHLHPTAIVKTGYDRLRLPCFFIERDRNRLILPAFSLFTNGIVMETTSPENQIFVVAGSQLRLLPPRAFVPGRQFFSKNSDL